MSHWIDGNHELVYSVLCNAGLPWPCLRWVSVSESGVSGVAGASAKFSSSWEKTATRPGCQVLPGTEELEPLPNCQAWQNRLEAASQATEHQKTRSTFVKLGELCLEIDTTFYTRERDCRASNLALTFIKHQSLVKINLQYIHRIRTH